MKCIFVLSLACSLASLVAGQEAAAACAADADADDDHCQLLQSGVGVVDRHEEKHDENTHHSDSAAEEGWPEALKGVVDTVKEVGGMHNLQEDFTEIQTAVAAFSTDSHTAIKRLIAEIRPKTSVETIVAEVEKAETKIHHAAEKLWAALTKVTSTFMNGLGKVVPSAFRTAMKTTLDHISTQALHFSNSFKNARRPVNADIFVLCGHIKNGLENLNSKASMFGMSSAKLTTQGLPKEFKAAHDALPPTLKVEIDKVLAEANKAAAELTSDVSNAVKEITDGIAKAFTGHCGDVLHKFESGAGRAEFGLLTAIVISVLGLAM